MDLKYILLGFCLLFVLIVPVFAVTNNSIENFELAWNSNTNQLNIGLQCKSQTLATLVLSNGASREFICGTMDFGQSWLLGEQPNINQLSGILTINSPCVVCSKSAQVNIKSNEDQNELFVTQVVFAIILVLGILFSYGCLVS